MIHGTNLEYREYNLDTREMAQNIDILRKPTLKKEVVKKTPQKRVVSLARTSLRPESTERDSPLERSTFPVWYRFCAVALLCVFLLQPVANVRASEDVSGEVSTEQESTVALETVSLEATEIAVADGPQDSDDEEDSSNSSESSSVEPSSAPESEGLENESVEGDASSAVNQAEESIEEVSEIPSELDQEGVGEDGDAEAEEVPVTEASESDSVTVGAEEQNSGTTTTEMTEEETEISETENLVENTAENATTATSSRASTTEEVGVVMPEISEGVSDLNRYQFGVNDCVTVEDGFFYCSKGTMPKMTMEDRVYAAQDADGDFEIFISKDGVDTQITHNLVDDNAPQYDAKSNRLAWHSLVNDRYQILVYDFTNESMVQLTDETFNNMEPAMLGEKTVWQAWVVNNWEIILDDNGERTQLTTNESHDIDPFIRGDLISWQSQNGEGWDIKIYNTKTKELDIVAGAGGASAQNPRFVLMYDSTKENGDVETVGYDIESGETIPLAAVPRSVPDTIPEPPHSKEKSAFVQTNPTLKNEVEAEVDDTVGTTTISGGDDTDESDVVVPPVVSIATSTSVENVDIPVLGVSGMELDLRAMATNTNEVVSHAIPDLVIPPAVSVETNASSSEPL